MTEVLIGTTDLKKSFGGQSAVDGVSLEVKAGSFLSIIGPNGAGKTTLFNLITGQLMPTAGTVLYRGKDITWLKPHQRANLGMGRSFQLTNLFPNLPVMENVRLAVQAHKANGYQLFEDYLKDKSIIELAMEAIAQVNLTNKLLMPAAALTHGEKRKLELAMILAMETDALLLDEPTAGMSLEEVPAILEILSEIKRQKKKTIVLVEHKMDVVLNLSDEIAVMVNGSLLVKDVPKVIMEHPQVQLAYLGEVV